MRISKNTALPPFKVYYQAAADPNVVVKASPGYLHAIIIGEWVTGGTIEVSDHASDGDGNVKIYLTAGTTDASGFPKVIPIQAEFSTGITADITGAQTHVAFIYR